MREGETLGLHFVLRMIATALAGTYTNMTVRTATAATASFSPTITP